MGRAAFTGAIVFQLLLPDTFHCQLLGKKPAQHPMKNKTKAAKW